MHAIRSVEHPAFDAVLERQAVDGRSKANALDDTANDDQSVNRNLLVFILIKPGR
jgi:hypothetical protein